MAKRRYLFFDIDGTLAAGGYGRTYIPDSAVLALQRLRAAGHVLALATGRAQAMAVDGDLLGITPLSRERVIALIRECEEKGFPWGLQVDNSATRLVPDGRFADFTHDVYMRTRVVPGLDPEDYPELYKAYVACFAPDEEQLDLLRELPWCRFHKEYLFVEPSDKAFGIRRVMDHFEVSYDRAVVFGDAKNDLSMFVDGWTKVAMGNAIDELKARADYVTSDVEDDGIYRACEALGLFEPVDE